MQNVCLIWDSSLINVIQYIEIASSGSIDINKIQFLPSSEIPAHEAKKEPIRAVQCKMSVIMTEPLNRDALNENLTPLGK